jgi:hypothetical protein
MRGVLLARGLAGFLLVLWLTLVAAPLCAETVLPAGELEKVQTAVERGAFSDAIDLLEHWSDRGVVHPDLSFDRGVAYLGRAESSAARPLDLGQAAAAFEESAQLNPADEEAKRITGRIRELISERRAKRDDAGVVARPRLLRALLDLIGENVWAGLALFGTALLTVGLAVRLFNRSERIRLATGIVSLAGGLLLVVGGGMASAGAYLRAHFSPAVVIVEEARLLDAAGRPFSNTRGPSTLGEAGDRVPAGALVHVAETRGALARVEWADMEAWVNTRELRLLARP